MEPWVEVSPLKRSNSLGSQQTRLFDPPLNDEKEDEKLKKHKETVGDRLIL